MVRSQRWPVKGTRCCRPPLQLRVEGAPREILINFNVPIGAPAHAIVPVGGFCAMAPPPVDPFPPPRPVLLCAGRQHPKLATPGCRPR
jgi:hypothetical protein